MSYVDECYSQSTPDTRGLGAPLSREQVQAKQREEEEEARREAEESSKPPPPPRPFRIDTTGLSTSHLPPPPGRKDGADGRSPTMSPPPVVARSKPPGLPPRLPPRQNSNPAPSPPPTYTSEPPAHRGMLNQGSLNRLGASGISVPGFGIGNSTSSPSKETPSPGGHSSQLNELQSRFSRLSPSRSESPVEGTTFAQKQAALKTASSFRNDPSSVSLSDARSAASTANNFRERHGEQVKSGWQSANSLNSKYGISDKVGMYSGLRDSHEPEEAYTPIEMKDNTASSPEPVIAAKKKPPPPPVKRAGLSSPTVGRDGGPPPIPLSSKPKPPAGGYS